MLKFLFSIQQQLNKLGHKIVKDKHNIDTKTNLDPKNDKTKALETDDNSQLTESDQVWNQNL